MYDVQESFSIRKKSHKLKILKENHLVLWGVQTLIILKFLGVSSKMDILQWAARWKQQVVSPSKAA